MTGVQTCALPICVYPDSLECGFPQDVLRRTFPPGRVAHKHKFVELPLILRGHSLSQSKDQVERISHHRLNMLFEGFFKFQNNLAIEG